MTHAQIDPATAQGREPFDGRKIPRLPYRRTTTMKNCSFMLDLESREALERTAIHLNLSKGEALRRAIAAYAKREGPRPIRTGPAQ